mmetsp:Transcript_12015/g.35682  ORF Transcript_12015/g.35682 Transcript_12015/m.35682 type:complete len:988 (-) Transcript_12015:47-3010(-)
MATLSMPPGDGSQKAKGWSRARGHMRSLSLAASMPVSTTTRRSSVMVPGVDTPDNYSGFLAAQTLQPANGGVTAPRVSAHANGSSHHHHHHRSLSVSAPKKLPHHHHHGNSHHLPLHAAGMSTGNGHVGTPPKGSPVPSTRSSAIESDWEDEEEALDDRDLHGTPRHAPLPSPERMRRHRGGWRKQSLPAHLSPLPRPALAPVEHHSARSDADSEDEEAHHGSWSHTTGSPFNGSTHMLAPGTGSMSTHVSPKRRGTMVGNMGPGHKRGASLPHAPIAGARLVSKLSRIDSAANISQQSSHTSAGEDNSAKVAQRQPGALQRAKSIHTEFFPVPLGPGRGAGVGASGPSAWPPKWLNHPDDVCVEVRDHEASGLDAGDARWHLAAGGAPYGHTQGVAEDGFQGGPGGGQMDMQDPKRSTDSLPSKTRHNILLGVLAVLVALLLVATLTKEWLSDDGRTDRRSDVAVWHLEFNSESELAEGGWVLTSSLWGSSGGFQWYRPANARVVDGVLTLRAQPTDLSATGPSGEPFGAERVLGCARDTAAAATSKCARRATEGNTEIDLGYECQTDPLRYLCAAQSGVEADGFAPFASMLPPATSAQLHAPASSGSPEAPGGRVPVGVVTHGRLEIRARLPVGDWLRAGIDLVPAPLQQPSARASNPLNAQRVHVLDARGNKCSSDTRPGAQAFTSRVEWGVGATQFFGEWTASTFRDAEGDWLHKDWHTFGLVRTNTTMYTYVDDDANRVLELELERTAATDMERLCVTARGHQSSCTIWFPVPDPAASTIRASGLFDVPLALVMQLAVGDGFAPLKEDAGEDDGEAAEASSFFGDAGMCGKPWEDGATDAAAHFYAARDTWFPTWVAPELSIDWIRFYDEAAEAKLRAIAREEEHEGRSSGGDKGSGGGSAGTVSMASSTGGDLVRLGRTATKDVSAFSAECQACMRDSCALDVEDNCAARKGFAEMNGEYEMACLCGCCLSACAEEGDDCR